MKIMFFRLSSSTDFRYPGMVSAACSKALALRGPDPESNAGIIHVLGLHSLVTIVARSKRLKEQRKKIPNNHCIDMRVNSIRFVPTRELHHPLAHVLPASLTPCDDSSSVPWKGAQQRWPGLLIVWKARGLEKPGPFGIRHLT